jgi:hypothetical protein
MTTVFANSAPAERHARDLAPLWVGAATYLLLLFAGDGLLHDPDTLWQIKVGQWILDHGTVPTTDIYSFTRQGEAWLSTSWLAQVLLASAYALGGWTGPVVLSAIAVASAVAMLFAQLARHLARIPALLFAMLAVVLAAPHLLARPHVLALPIMVAWAGGLMAAADRSEAPSPLLLPLIVLWANLHGGFVLGLALTGAIGLEALESAAPERRLAQALRWAAFGLAALAASCCTPYGWSSLLASARIINLGESFKYIAEWRPADFSHISAFAMALLGLVGLAFFRGLKLSAPRIMLILVMTWMALSHVRSIETFAVIVPLALAKPLGAHLRLRPPERVQPGSAGWFPSARLAAVAIVLAATVSTSIYASYRPFGFSTVQTPVAAVDLLVARKAERIFNSYGFGAYLIARDVKPFVDGRSELYGEKFLVDFFAAEDAHDVAGLLRMLDAHRIDATLLTADSPAAQVLDHIPGWTRLYADKQAIVHVRSGTGHAVGHPAPGSSR